MPSFFQFLAQKGISGESKTTYIYLGMARISVGWNTALSECLNKNRSETHQVFLAESPPSPSPLFIEGRAEREQMYCESTFQADGRYLTTVGEPEREAGIWCKVQMELAALAVGETRT